MIWLESKRFAFGEDPVRRALQSGWDPLVGPYLRMPERLADVCAAVATAWEVDCRGGPLPPQALQLMASRALWMADEPDAARGMAEHAAADPVLAEGWMRLVERGGPSLSACLCLGAGLLRPSRTALDAAVPVWRLEVGRLATASGELAAMGVPGRMLRILRQTAEIWDAGSGRGVLVLSGGGAGASGRLEEMLRESGVPVCREGLARLAEERGWRTRPEVRRAGIR